MKNEKFCHLHLHTDKGSLLDGVGQVSQYSEKAKELGFKYMGISDHGSIDAVIDFEKSCREKEISPIIGCELYVSCDDDWKGTKKHMCVYVKNETGWRNLTKMLSYANLETFYRKPTVELGTVYENCEGLIITTACVGSWLRLDSGIEFFEEIHKKIGDDLYLEIMPHNHPLQEEMNQICLDLAKKHDVKLITTCDCHYINKEDAILQDVLLAIQQGKTWNDPNRFSIDFRDLYLMTANEVLSLYKNQKVVDVKTAKQSIRNTIEIAKKCEGFKIPKPGISLPSVKKHEDLSVAENIEKICFSNFKKKFGKSIKKDRAYRKRFKKEIEVICEKKFENYFMILWDFIAKCKKQDIAIGPGRGSCCGSLICYLLEITKVDPLKHDLIFERFLNRERIDWPDIDIDIEKVKIAEARQILEETYGENNVAGISTYNKMKDKGALRDVSRVFGVPLDLVNSFSKEMGKELSIAEVVEKTEVGRHFKKHYQNVIDLASRLSGTIRNASQHAAGIIISNSDLRTGAQCSLARRKKQIVVNWEMKNAEQIGLMKIDALSLSNLSIIKEAKKLALETHGVEIAEKDSLSLDDAETLKSFEKAETSGIFQFNAYTMTKWTKMIRPNSFNLISDTLALSRPGPIDSGLAEEFVARKNGKKWDKKNAIYEKITEKTLGVLVYQEDLMRIFTEMAGLPYTVADNIRKIIGKKRDASEFEKYKEMFIEGCKKLNTLDEEGVEEFWKVLEANANYSFNASHSCGYGYIAYETMWLKVHYPMEYYCASLTYIDEGKKEDILIEASRRGIGYSLPKVGKSKQFRWVPYNGVLLAPFSEIKGFGEKDSQKALEMTKDNIQTKSFFVVKEKVKGQTKIEHLLRTVNAYDDRELDKSINKYFDIPVSLDYSITHPKLIKFVGEDFTDEEYCQIENGKIFTRSIIGLSKTKDVVKNCDYCKDDYPDPIFMENGKSSGMVVFDRPTKADFENKDFFQNRSFNSLKKKLVKGGVNIERFYKSFLVKCYEEDKSEDSVSKCSLCLERDVQYASPTFVIAIGSGPSRFFFEDESVMHLTGKVKWSEKYGCFVFVLMSPFMKKKEPDLWNESLKNLIYYCKNWRLKDEKDNNNN